MATDTNPIHLTLFKNSVTEFNHRRIPGRTSAMPLSSVEGQGRYNAEYKLTAERHMIGVENEDVKSRTRTIKISSDVSNLFQF